MEEYEYERQQKEKRDKKIAGIFEFGVYLILICAITYFVKSFVIQRAVVDGSSMNNTLCDGDSVLVEKISYVFGDIDRFDVVVFPHTEKDGTTVNYIKRVIGLPMETVTITDGKIYIDDEELEEDYGYYIDEKMMEGYDAEEGITLGQGEYFVLGDNRNNSKDSRKIGAVREDDIIGRAFFVIFPFDRFGSVSSE